MKRTSTGHVPHARQARHALSRTSRLTAQRTGVSRSFALTVGAFLIHEMGEPMKAITVIESDDGAVTGVGSDVNEDTTGAVELRHRGIEVIATPTRWVIGKEDHGSYS